MVSGIMTPTWAQRVYEAILAAAKAEVGIDRIQFTRKEILRPGTEIVDRIEVALVIKAQ